jgi:HAE1 family hydrophobic/amphiphilic exporter-1
MGLTRLAIQRPLTMLMIILGLVVMGYRALTLLQVDRFPKVDIPVVSVVTSCPGASPADVEDLIVKPIEDAVAGISGIDQLNSVSSEGLGVVTIQFVEGTDSNQAAIDVERQVATVRGQLPTDAEDPSVIKADINAIPIMQLVLSGPQDPGELFDLAQNTLKPRLEAVAGVASVNVSGGREREIQVYTDPAKLAAFQLTLASVQQSLAANNLTLPVGSLEQGRQKSSVRSVGEFTSLDEISNVILSGEPKPSNPGDKPKPVPTPGQDQGGLVYLRNVASVQEGFKDETQRLRYNGQDTVNISIVKTTDANTIAVADAVRQALATFQKDLPPGARLTTVIDNSKYTRESVAAVQEDLILAILITGLVMLVFLHTIRSTFIVVLAIPTSIISTFLVMWALGFSLNTLTLLALTLVIGILVDDSIVILENIERHLKLKKGPVQAALDGRAEIGLAAITIALVDVVVYLPVAFTSGIIGQFFRSYGITIAVTTLFSLFVSFTLTPMLAALWLKDESEPATEARPTGGLSKFFSALLRPLFRLWNGFTHLWEAGFNRLSDVYAATLRWVLANVFTQVLAVLVAVVALAIGIFLVISGVVGSEFFPQEDDGQFSVNIQMPPSASLDATDQAARQVEQLILSKVPETVSILTSVGSGGSSNIFASANGGDNTASLTVSLVDKTQRVHSTTAIVNALRPLVKQIPEANIALQLTSSIGGGGGSPIQVQVYGADANTLIDLSNKVEAVMKSVPGTVDVLNTAAARAPDVRLVVDRDRAADQGLSPAQIASTLRTALSGSQVNKYKQPDQTDLDITLRANETSRRDLTQLLQLPLSYLQGQRVTLDKVATVEQSEAPARILRTNRQRVLTINSGVSGRAAGDVTNDIEAALKAKVDFPAGYGFQFVGQSQTQRQSFTQLGQALLLSIVLIYMLLVALYQSWLQPLAIMFSLPVTLVGAFGGLWLTGNTLNIISILGIILLTGVVTKNAILLVDFTNTLRREQGHDRKTALVEAGRLRLRPILMTTAALVFALLPLLFGVSAGSETRAPLAAVVIGGNISSTLLTLILVPVVYNFFDWGGGLASTTLGNLWRRRKPGPVVPRRPGLEPGSAFSFNPPPSQPDPDTV